MSASAVHVSYYTCACDWISKYCDEHHRASVFIPLDVLEKYREEQS